MIFKPRVFISSTFSDNIKLRGAMKEFLEKIGAEPMLYERNLTPSTVPMTYRENILEADFVVLIMKDNYGTKTDLGISGTHEEYQIAKENGIPIHVYLKVSNSKQSKKNKLVDEIIEDGNSYYYFSNDMEALERFKETTFTIAKEIMLRKVNESNLDDQIIKKITINRDYKKALEIISIVEKMKKYHKLLGMDYQKTTLFSDFVSPIIEYHEKSVHIFINWRLDELLAEALYTANEFINFHVIDYTTIPNTNRELNVPELGGKVIVNDVSYFQNTDLDSDGYDTILKNFFTKIEALKKEVMNLKLQADLI